MKTLIALIALGSLVASTISFAQDSTNAAIASAASKNAVATPPPIPEEARKHFVIGTTLFKDAKTPDDYSQVVSEFKQAADLAPQWPEARYNLALAKEAAGNYSGAIEDLKLYQQFKLSDDEARTVQDKIYALEAKQTETAKRAADEAAKAQQEAAAAQEKMRHILAGRWEEDSASVIETLSISGSDGNYQGAYSCANKLPTALPLGLVMENFSASGTSLSFRVSQNPGGGYWTVRDYDLRVSQDGTALIGSCSSQSNFGGVHSSTSDAKWNRVQ